MLISFRVTGSVDSIQDTGSVDGIFYVFMSSFDKNLGYTQTKF